jgi:hypothetical protein
VIVYTEIPSIQSRNPYSPFELNGFYLAAYRREKHINDSSSTPMPEHHDGELPTETTTEAGGMIADGGGKPARPVRSRDGKNIIFRVFPEEHADIARRASEAGLTVSEFIRRIALGHKTQSRFDYDVMEYLIKMHTDMNRLGNLFKLSLKHTGDGDGGNGASLSYTEREWQRSILKSIEENQELLRNYIGGFTA